MEHYSSDVRVHMRSDVQQHEPPVQHAPAELRARRTSVPVVWNADNGHDVILPNCAYQHGRTGGYHDHHGIPAADLGGRAPEMEPP